MIYVEYMKVVDWEWGREIGIEKEEWCKKKNGLKMTMFSVN